MTSLASPTWMFVLLTYFLCSGEPLQESNTSPAMFRLCSDKQFQFQIEEWRLPNILCGCFKVEIWPTTEGFLILALLSQAFWKSVELLHALNVRFLVYLQMDDIQISQGEIICKTNATECRGQFINKENKTTVQGIKVYLSCDSEFSFVASSPCMDCSFIQLYYAPPVTKLPPSTSSGDAAITTTDDSLLSPNVLYVIITLAIVVICVVVTFIVFFVYHRRKARSQSRPGESISTEPLVSATQTSQSLSAKEILVIDIAPEEECSKQFRNILKSVPRFNIVCFIDHLKAVNENMYDWAHKKLRTCDFIVVVLSNELTGLFESNSCEILQTSPYADIVKYLLTQMNKDMYTTNNTVPRHTGVQLVADVELPSSFTDHLANISFRKIYTLQNLSRLRDDNNTYSQLNLLLLTMGADNEEIKLCVSA